MIQLHSVSLAYQKDATALNAIDLRIEKGEFVFLTGPSGAGKTTLLRLLYGALTPTRGQVLIDGQNVSRLEASQIPYLRRVIGVVFQDFKLLPSGPSLRMSPSPWRCSAGAAQISAKRSCRPLNWWGSSPRST